MIEIEITKDNVEFFEDELGVTAEVGETIALMMEVDDLPEWIVDEQDALIALRCMDRMHQMIEEMSK